MSGDRSPTSALSNHVAVVTGGGRGIGRAIAGALAQAGARVAVLARTRAELDETVARITQGGGSARALALDVTDREAVARAFADVQGSLGPIDLLVNNAGVIGPLGPLWENDADAWWRAMEVNLRGPLLCSHAVLAGMVARRRGRIVNIASGAATHAFTYYSSYVAGKTALVRLTECLANELRPHGVSAFAIEPGTVRTAMTGISLNSDAGRTWIPWFRRIFDAGMDSPPERAAARVVELAGGRFDALSGLLLPIGADLETLLASRAAIERDQLYSLRLRQLDAAPNPALAALRAEGERAR